MALFRVDSRNAIAVFLFISLKAAVRKERLSAGQEIRKEELL